MGMEGGKQTVPKARKGRLGHILSYYKRKRMLTCDGMRYQVAARAVKKMSSKRACRNQVVGVAVIGHPKMIDDLWMTNFESMLLEMKKIKTCELITMQKIGALLKK